MPFINNVLRRQCVRFYFDLFVLDSPNQRSKKQKSAVNLMEWRLRFRALLHYSACTKAPSKLVLLFRNKQHKYARLHDTMHAPNEFQFIKSIQYMCKYKSDKNFHDLANTLSGIFFLMRFVTESRCGIADRVHYHAKQSHVCPGTYVWKTNTQHNSSRCSTRCSSSRT